MVCFNSKAQLFVTRNVPYNSIQYLVKNILLGNGVLVSNITYSGDDTSFGFFNGINSNIGIDSGIILTNGRATDAMGPNNSPSTTFQWPNCTSYTDPDLAAIAATTVTSCSIIQFDFIPYSDTVKFNYVFGSEEYPEFVNQFNDAFGFFLSGPTINGPYTNNAENIAVLPNTSTAVTINNVNCTVNSAYYVCNWPSNVAHPCNVSCPTNAQMTSTTVQYDGFTVPLTAIGVVQCGLTYHIKIAICNAGDCAYESGVFLQAGSFSSTGTSVSTGVAFNNTFYPNDSVIYRGNCGNASILIERPNATSPDTIIIDTAGTATPGVDYTPLPDTSIMGIGVKGDTLRLNALSSSSTGTKTIIVHLIQHICNLVDTQTVRLYIENPPPITIVAPPRVACFNGNTILTAAVSGGVPGGYTFKWSNGGTANVDTVKHITSDTTFIVKVKDFCADSASDTVHVSLPAPLHLTISDDTTLSCPHDTLVITATISGGKSGYSYLWSNSATSTTSSQKVVTLSTTKYFVTVTDTCGSVAKDSMTVTISPVPPLILSSHDTTINCSGTVTPYVHASGGSGGYIYNWSNGGTTSSISVTATKDTSYIVTVHSPCGNQVKTDTVKITVIPPSWHITLTGNPNICSGQSTTLTASGGTTYLWTPGNNTNSSITVSPGSTQTYSVAVSTGNCFRDTTVKVTVTPTPTVSVVPPTQTICIGDSASLTANATNGVTYKWSSGQTSSAIKIAPAASGTYTVVVSNSGCLDSTTSIVNVKVPNVNLCCDTTILQGGTAVLLATSGEISYVWNPTNGLSCTSCSTPLADPTATTTYTLTVVDQDGCIVNRTVTVTVELPCADFKVPSIFTPNNDGINDDFVINIVNASSYSISIYDRWGKLVYTSNNPAEYWNGRYNGTDNLVPDGVYYYMLKATCGSNDYSKKGFVEVVGEK